jgi:hypothetical protein
MKTNDRSRSPRDDQGSAPPVTQDEADRFNAYMEAHRRPHRARIERDETPHFVIEPPLPTVPGGGDFARIYADRDMRRLSLVEQRDATSDPQTRRRLDLMIATHDRGTDRIGAYDPDRRH